MMNRFEGKVALVSGAASGIGRAAAIRIANEGGSVVCIDLQREAVEATAKEICENGGSALALTCDVSDVASVREAVAAGVKQYGRLDALCNAAGILRFDDTLELAVEDWERVLAVNLTGTFLMCQAALPHLIEANGHIVNITSTSALAGQPWSAAYGASKGGVLALTRTLAIEFGRRGVRVNSISPGSIDTPITKAFRFPEGADQSLLQRIVPFDQFGQPEDIGSAVAYLCSGEARHINGTDLRIDGGTLS